MTGNKILDYLLQLDHQTSLCELLELIKQDKDEFIKLFNETEPVIDTTNTELLERIKDFYTLVDYSYWCDKRRPHWINYEIYYNKYAKYHGKHLTDYDKFVMFTRTHEAFRRRNIYFKIEGLGRVLLREV